MKIPQKLTSVNFLKVITHLRDTVLLSEQNQRKHSGLQFQNLSPFNKFIAGK